MLSFDTNFGSYTECENIKIGNYGECVCKIQKILNQFGFKVPISGRFDVKTADGVIGFQGIAGLAQDGIVGPKTWKALLEQYKQSGGGKLTPPYCPANQVIGKKTGDGKIKDLLPYFLLGTGTAIIFYYLLKG